jgi:hypothetical protein
MSGTTQMIIAGTIGVIILMWVLTRPTDFQNVMKSISDLYTGSVGALVPKTGGGQ